MGGACTPSIPSRLSGQQLDHTLAHAWLRLVGSWGAKSPNRQIAIYPGPALLLLPCTGRVLAFSPFPQLLPRSVPYKNLAPPHLLHHPSFSLPSPPSWILFVFVLVPFLALRSLNSQSAYFDRLPPQLSPRTLPNTAPPKWVNSGDSRVFSCPWH